MPTARAGPDPGPSSPSAFARWGATFILDPDGVTRTKALGAERMARKVRDALPGADQPLRDAVWTFLRPILSPQVTALNRNDLVPDVGLESTVDLAAHYADADLDELDLGDDRPEAA